MAITLVSQFTSPASIHNHNGLRVRVSSDAGVPEIKMKVVIKYDISGTTITQATVYIRPISLTTNIFEINIAEFLKSAMKPEWLEGATGLLSLPENECVDIDVIFTELYYDVNDVYTEYTSLTVNCGDVYNMNSAPSDYILNSIVTLKDFLSVNTQEIITSESPAVFNFISTYTGASVQVTQYNDLASEPWGVGSTTEYPLGGGSVLHRYRHFILNHTDNSVLAYRVRVLNTFGASPTSNDVFLYPKTYCDTATLYWVNSNSGWNTMVFKTISKERMLSETDESYNINSDELTSGYRVNKVKSQDEYELTLHNRSQAEIDLFYTVFNSPRVLMNYGGDTFAVIVTGKPKDKKEYSKLPSLSVTVRKSIIQDSINAY